METEDDLFCERVLTAPRALELVSRVSEGEGGEDFYIGRPADLLVIPGGGIKGTTSKVPLTVYFLSAGIQRNKSHKL